VERVRAAHAQAARANVILVARTEVLLHDAAQVTQAIDTLVAFADAGADCLYAPGVTRREDIAAMVKAVAPKPVNVLMFGPGLTVAELAGLGVRRISIGGTLARVGWHAVMVAAEQIKAGSFDGLANVSPGKKLNEIFGGFPQ
jgi:2-methylisocitrate lyase-like PEP mutase family enzyme